VFEGDELGRGRRVADGPAAAGYACRVSDVEQPPARRNTRQRDAVVGLLAEVEGFHSAQELYMMLRSRGDGVGLTTVYRTLQFLAESGEIDVMQPPGSDTRYRRCSDNHHHHLVCRTCGRTEEVLGPAVERWADRVAEEHGFVDVSHTLEIFGTCGRCAR
jgi:Fur family transcriptional regulator, ferric uptake regulator